MALAKSVRGRTGEQHERFEQVFYAGTALCSPTLVRFDLDLVDIVLRGIGIDAVDLAPNAGRLFVYREPAYLSMWMKNTLIPLDMLFVRADGSVASIAEHTEPQSTRSIGAEELVQYVLELNAGTIPRAALVPGSRLFVDAEEFLTE